MEIRSESGCVIIYSERPIELPNKEKVYFKIESIVRAKGVSDDDLKTVLKDIENKINWDLLEKTKANSLSPMYPHFYFDEVLKDGNDFSVMVEFFHMKPVEELGIMLYPGRGKMTAEKK